MRPSPPALLLLAALLLSSCAAPVRRAMDIPLSETTFRLPNGGPSGSVPAGWTEAKSGADPLAAAALVAGDSLSIVFRPIALDSSSAFYFGKRGVADLAMLTRTLRDSTVGNVRDGIETFKSGGRECAAFEARADGRRSLVAVFGWSGRYYECEAAPSRPLSSPASYELLRAVQQAVLQSLK